MVGNLLTKCQQMRCTFATSFLFLFGNGKGKGKGKVAIKINGASIPLPSGSKGNRRGNESCAPVCRAEVR